MSELLTRLNPKTARLDIGSGGRQELSDQDIAAALGMVRNKLGAGMLAYLHCPTEQSQYRFEVDCFRLMRETFDQSVNAEIAYHLAANKGARPDRSGIASMTWPAFEPRRMGMYARLVLAVLGEIAGGATCKTCNGRGSVQGDGGIVTCADCSGSGRRHNPQRDRASRLGIPLGHYQRKWETPYRWLFGELVNAMADADREFRAALGRNAA